MLIGGKVIFFHTAAVKAVKSEQCKVCCSLDTATPIAVNACWKSEACSSSSDFNEELRRQVEDVISEVAVQAVAIVDNSKVDVFISCLKVVNQGT